VTRPSIVLAVLGMIGTGAVIPYLKRRLSHPSSYHYWLLGLSALFPAWLVAFVSLLPSSTAGADRIPLPRPALFSSAAIFFGIILTDYVLRRMNRAGRVYKPVTYWLLGVAALLPGWCIALLL
jgi:hypothetical protein